tara:strand:- start:15732 stop:16463 length:732 start_codon:yes stop_codon:yes gene_type:complete
MEDGRPRCRCRVWGDPAGTGPQCQNPAKTDGICGTHHKSRRICGYYDEPRPTIWGTSYDGSHMELGSKCEKNRGKPIPWVSNVAEPRENTARPDESVDDYGTGRAPASVGRFKGEIEHIFVGVKCVLVSKSEGSWGLYFDPDPKYMKKVGRDKRIAKFSVSNPDNIKAKKAKVPDGHCLISCWVNEGGKDKWNELLNLPKYQCLRDEFESTSDKQTIIVPYDEYIGDNHGALNDLIRDCFKPW